MQLAQGDTRDGQYSSSTEVCWSCCVCLPRHDEFKTVEAENIKLKTAIAVLSEKVNELENNDKKQRKAYLDLHNDSVKISDEMNIIKDKFQCQKRKLLDLELEVDNLRKTYIHLQGLVTKYELHNRRIKNGKNVLEMYDEVSAQVKDLLFVYFTDTQIDFILTGMPVRKWTTNDIVCGIAFRAVSPKGYNYVRKQLILPFPSVSTIKTWSKGHIFTEGLLHIVLNLMKGKSESMTKAECACV